MGGFYRMEVKVVSRGTSVSKRNSAVEAAAYIDGEKYKRSAVETASYISGTAITGTEKTYDYSHKEGVIFSDIVLPKNAPLIYKNPEILWNEVEKIEGNRANATLFREWIACLDKHLSQENMLTVARQFAEELSSEGMVVHYALHNEKDGNGNFHIHFLAPTRSIDENGNFQKRKILPREYVLDEKGERIPCINSKTGKQRTYASGELSWKREARKYVDAFNDPKLHNVDRWRECFAKIENEYLPEEYQVSSQSYEEQGIDKIPTRHLGKAKCSVKNNFEKNISSLSEEKRQEYLTKITEEIQQEYRRMYYQNSRNLCAENKKVYSRKNELREEIAETLTLLYVNHPRKAKTYLYEDGRKRFLLEYLLVKLIRFLKYLIEKTLWENRLEESLILRERLQNAENELLIVYVYGNSLSTEDFLQSEMFEIKKQMLKEIGAEIYSIEKEIKSAKEDDYERLYRKLAGCGEILGRLDAFGAVGEGEQRTSEAIERIHLLSRELEESIQRMGKSSSYIDETFRAIYESERVNDSKELPMDEEKIRKGKSLRH